jgi:glycosyltransferase involved in cell wall biosynthesis
MPSEPARVKVIVVMPAYNASKTLRLTYQDLPHDAVDSVILVDDASRDDTVKIARELGLEVLSTATTTATGPTRKRVTARPSRPAPTS